MLQRPAAGMQPRGAEHELAGGGAGAGGAGATHRDDRGPRVFRFDAVQRLAACAPAWIIITQFGASSSEGGALGAARL